MPNIVGCHVREILDSRGNPTVEVDVVLQDGCLERVALPSGASTGEHEAVELGDNHKGRYLGKRLTKAVKNANDATASQLPEDGLDVVASVLADLPAVVNDLNSLLGIDISKHTKKEIDLHYFVEAFLRPLGFGLDHKPKVDGVRSCRYPDTGIEKLSLLIEYKYMRRREDYERIKKAVAEDIGLYLKSPWRHLFFVIYQRRNFFDQTVWRGEFSHQQLVRFFCMSFG